MAQAALPLAIAGTAIKTIGKYKAGKYNAAVSRAQAQDELNVGAAEAEQKRLADRRAMGEQIAQQGASGFEVGTGTALEALRESAINSATDLAEIRRSASSRSAALREQARMQSKAANMALLEGAIDAASTVAGYKSDYAQSQGRHS